MLDYRFGRQKKQLKLFYFLLLWFEFWSWAINFSIKIFFNCQCIVLIKSRKIRMLFRFISINCLKMKEKRFKTLELIYSIWRNYVIFLMFLVGNIFNSKHFWTMFETDECEEYHNDHYKSWATSFFWSWLSTLQVSLFLISTDQIVTIWLLVSIKEFLSRWFELKLNSIIYLFWNWCSIVVIFKWNAWKTQHHSMSFNNLHKKNTNKQICTKNIWNIWNICMYRNSQFNQKLY